MASYRSKWVSRALAKSLFRVPPSVLQVPLTLTGGDWLSIGSGFSGAALSNGSDEDEVPILNLSRLVSELQDA